MSDTALSRAERAYCALAAGAIADTLLAIERFASRADAWPVADLARQLANRARWEQFELEEARA